MTRKAGSNGVRTAGELRKAALSLFAQRGYAAVSMRQIAGQLGIQASALYNYWPTKQDLLVDLLDQHMTGLLAAWDDEVLPFNDPAGELDAFARFHIRYHIRRPDEVFVAYMELRSLEPQHFRRHEKLRQTYEAHLREILRRGVSRGVFEIDDVKVAAMAIIAMLTGVNTWYRSGGRLSRAAIEDIYADMVLGSVGARGVVCSGETGQTSPDAAPVNRRKRKACSTTE